MSEQASMRVNINLAEIKALFQLAGRAPMTEAEQLWYQGMVQRWNESQDVPPGPARPVEVDSGPS